MSTARPGGDLAIRAVLLMAMGLFSIWVMHPVALNGDELSYTRGGQTLGLWARSLFGDTGAQGSVLDESSAVGGIEGDRNGAEPTDETVAEVKEDFQQLTDAPSRAGWKTPDF